MGRSPLEPRRDLRLETAWNGTAGSGSELLRLVGTAPRLVEAVPGSGGLPLDGLGIRLVHVDRRRADAEEAARRLRALGATVELLETSDSGNEVHTGTLYVPSRYRQLADAIIGAAGDLEQLQAAEGTTFSPGPTRHRAAGGRGGRVGGRTMRTLETIGLLVLVAGLALTATPAGAATIVIQNNDGAGASTSDGCEPLVGFTAGRIAVIDRGTCQFGLKALHAEQAGAAGVVIADNQVSTDPFNMVAGEYGRQVKIPIQYITQANANTIRPTLPVNVTFDVIAAGGLHANGFVQLYTPNPVQLGSSISHYDELLGEHVSQTMGPNPLMGPLISPDLYNDPDMALGLYRDEGWTVVPVFADGFNSGSTWGWNFAVP